ncbi:MAG: hypothetical protein OXP11_23400 [Gammaproteobacteria bacterium]|nr:hypothetical protein [Gammaproteobacteria bacterium]
MAKSFTTGGDGLARYLKKTRQNAAKQPVVTVGFHDPAMSAIAVVHEFGAGRVPERPAFRLGVDQAERHWERNKPSVFRTGQDAVRHGSGVDDAKLTALAIELRDIIRQAYHDFHGAPLSERQRQRKAGTSYADEQLIGAEGPKLIGHIHAEVNGQQVG